MHPLIVSVELTSLVVCVVLLSHTPPPLLSCCAFSTIHFLDFSNNLWFLSYFIFLANQTDFVIAPILLSGLCTWTRRTSSHDLLVLHKCQLIKFWNILCERALQEIQASLLKTLKDLSKWEVASHRLCLWLRCLHQGVDDQTYLVSVRFLHLTFSSLCHWGRWTMEQGVYSWELNSQFLTL